MITILRGPRVSKVLERFDIDARRYWLLIDLFRDLSERNEMLDQLGRDGVALKTVTWFYSAMASVGGVLFVMADPPVPVYFATFLTVTGFVMLSVLLSETANSLVNPAEGKVLAHYPINGATYTAAKLTHLLRIILYLVPGLNAVPALAGLLMTRSRWSYPVVHLLAALAFGIVLGLFCCALFGWLIRLLPERRLKAAGQLAGIVPFMAMMSFSPLARWLERHNVFGWIPQEPGIRWALAAALGIIVAAVAAFGLRCLSADYLIRVSNLTRGSSPNHGGTVSA
jgi:hypothetical protein